MGNVKFVSDCPKILKVNIYHKWDKYLFKKKLDNCGHTAYTSFTKEITLKERIRQSGIGLDQHKFSKVLDNNMYGRVENED